MWDVETHNFTVTSAEEVDMNELVIWNRLRLCDCNSALWTCAMWNCVFAAIAAATAACSHRIFWWWAWERETERDMHRFWSVRHAHWNFLPKLSGLGWRTKIYRQFLAIFWWVFCGKALQSAPATCCSLSHASHVIDSRLHMSFEEAVLAYFSGKSCAPPPPQCWISRLSMLMWNSRCFAVFTHIWDKWCAPHHISASSTPLVEPKKGGSDKGASTVLETRAIMIAVELRMFGWTRPTTMGFWDAAIHRTSPVLMEQTQRDCHGHLLETKHKINIWNDSRCFVMISAALGSRTGVRLGGGATSRDHLKNWRPPKKLSKTTLSMRKSGAKLAVFWALLKGIRSFGGLCATPAKA